MSTTRHPAARSAGRAAAPVAQERARPPPRSSRAEAAAGCAGPSPRRRAAARRTPAPRARATVGRARPARPAGGRPSRLPIAAAIQSRGDGLSPLGREDTTERPSPRARAGPRPPSGSRTSAENGERSCAAHFGVHRDLYSHRRRPAGGGADDRMSAHLADCHLHFEGCLPEETVCALAARAEHRFADPAVFSEARRSVARRRRAFCRSTRRYAGSSAVRTTTPRRRAPSPIGSAGDGSGVRRGLRVAGDLRALRPPGRRVPRGHRRGVRGRGLGPGRDAGSSSTPSASGDPNRRSASSTSTRAGRFRKSSASDSAATRRRFRPPRSRRPICGPVPSDCGPPCTPANGRERRPSRTRSTRCGPTGSITGSRRSSRPRARLPTGRGRHDPLCRAVEQPGDGRGRDPRGSSARPPSPGRRARGDRGRRPGALWNVDAPGVPARRRRARPDAGRAARLRGELLAVRLLSRGREARGLERARRRRRLSRRPPSRASSRRGRGSARRRRRSETSRRRVRRALREKAVHCVRDRAAATAPPPPCHRRLRRGGGTRRFRPRTTSGSPPAVVPMTGTPQAMASSAASPNDSASEGSRKSFAIGQDRLDRSDVAEKRRPVGEAAAARPGAPPATRSGPSPIRRSRAGISRRTRSKTASTSADPLDRTEVRDVDEDRARPGGKSAAA